MKAFILEKNQGHSCSVLGKRAFTKKSDALNAAYAAAGDLYKTMLFTEEYTLVPVFRYADSNSEWGWYTDRLYTSNAPSEDKDGYKLQGLVGYAVPEISFFKEGDCLYEEIAVIVSDLEIVQ